MDRTLETAVCLRQARPADSAAIREFVCGLSPRSQQLRFFAAVAPPSTGLLNALTDTSGRADILLVTDGSGTLIAHGVAADAPANDGLESSIGLVVTDSWQRRGVGTLLLGALTTRAAGRGVGSLVMEVLADNHVMRGIIARRWPDARVEWTPDALVYRPALQPSNGGDNRAARLSAA